MTDEIAALESVLEYDIAEIDKHHLATIKHAARRHLGLLKAERAGLAKVVPCEATDEMMNDGIMVDREAWEQANAYFDRTRSTEALVHNIFRVRDAYTAMLSKVKPFDYEGIE